MVKILLKKSGKRSCFLLSYFLVKLTRKREGLSNLHHNSSKGKVTQYKMKFPINRFQFSKPPSLFSQSNDSQVHNRRRGIRIKVKSLYSKKWQKVNGWPTHAVIYQQSLLEPITKLFSCAAHPSAGSRAQERKHFIPVLKESTTSNFINFCLKSDVS